MSVLPLSSERWIRDPCEPVSTNIYREIFLDSAYGADAAPDPDPQQTLPRFRGNILVPCRATLQ